MKKIILILMLTVFGFSYSNDKTYKLTRAYNIEDINSFSLNSKNANIKVLPGDSKELTLSVTSNVKLEIEKQIHSQELEVAVLAPRHIFSFFSKSEDISIVVKVPKNFNKKLSIKSSNGSINASDLALDFKVITSNGNIDIIDITGNSNLRSSNGDITIINNTGNVEGKTSNGSINIDNNKGDIRFKTSNGNITAFKIDGSVNLKTSNSSILLTNASFIANLETSNGNITVNSDTLSKDGNIKTSNGDIELSIDKLEGNNKISTSNGLITLTTKKGEFNSNSYSKEKVQDISKNIILEGRKINIINKN
ncbi:DUF4097 family beta strand repeat-containing protein [Psychrilyobacter atlanticus]|uniref:DUF4097 family beta strand repeat-containing protein n=1 Tax=Psychrilyobacter atlanticus TaxID=271091 RepID=UPI0004001ADA|nr:DUF4097 family beta strand repeat-containing protein [Psychrilyobacter atlanticus]